MHMHPTPLRRAARATVVALAVGLTVVAAPAHAAPPETWEQADNGSALSNIVLLVGIPVAVFLLLTLLVYLPSMMRGQSSEEAFQERSEWFGGPRKGVEAAGQVTDGSTGAKGGAGGNW